MKLNFYGDYTPFTPTLSPISNRYMKSPANIKFASKFESIKSPNSALKIISIFITYLFIFRSY